MLRYAAYALTSFVCGLRSSFVKKCRDGIMSESHTWSIRACEWCTMLPNSTAIDCVHARQTHHTKMPKAGRPRWLLRRPPRC